MISETRTPASSATTTMARLRVRDLMTEGVFAVQPGDVLATVADLMDDHSVRHVPVVDAAGNLAGLVSHRDLLRHARRAGALPPEAEGETMEVTTAAEVMTRAVATAEPDQDIREAARLMLRNKYGCLPVVTHGRVVGILTESDFVRFLGAGD